MYEVYSQQRPGRPRWALGSSAILLLLTVVMAAALIQHKSGPDSLPLEPFGTPLFQGRRPVGWKEITSELPAATEAAWAEATDGKGAGRACFVFRRPMWPLAPADRLAKTAAREFAGEVFSLLIPGGKLTPSDNREPIPPSEPIAGLPGWTMKFKCTTQKDQAGYCLVRTTVIAPTGGSRISPINVLGVVVFVPGEARAAETRLLDRMSRQLRIGGVEPEGSSDEN